jgi:hypothetical protein
VDHNEDLLPVLFFTRTKQGNRYAQQDKNETNKKKHGQRWKTMKAHIGLESSLFKSSASPAL